MSDVPTTSAIVLAGGRSARFGSDKLDADLGGRSVLDRAIAAVRPIVDEILVVGRVGAAPGVVYLPDDEAFAGPLTGLAAGLRTARGDLALALGGDMALAHPGVLSLLLDRVEAEGPAAVALEESGALQPLPLALRRTAGLVAAEAALAAGDRSLRSLLGRLEVSPIREAIWRALDREGNTLVDVDTRDDLDRARARLERGA